MRFLVAGLGSIGERYVRNLRALGYSSIDVLRRAPRPTRTLQDADFTPIYDLDEALARRPDAVILANPTSMHTDVAIAAARAGAHLLIEIPLAGSLDRIDELAGLVKEKNLVVLMGHNLRFHPCLLALRDVALNGAIGAPVVARAEFGEYLPGCHPWEDYRVGYAARAELGGGAILTSIHEIDFVQWIMGPVVEVAAMVNVGSALEMNADDTAGILMRHRSGAMSEVHLDFIQPTYSRSCRIVGRDGAVDWHLRANTVTVAKHGGAGYETVFGLDAFDFNQTYLDEITHFVACIEGRETPINDLAEGARVLSLGLAALESSRTRKFVRVNPDLNPFSLSRSGHANATV